MFLAVPTDNFPAGPEDLIFILLIFDLWSSDSVSLGRSEPLRRKLNLRYQKPDELRPQGLNLKSTLTPILKKHTITLWLNEVNLSYSNFHMMRGKLIDVGQQFDAGNSLDRHRRLGNLKTGHLVNNGRKGK